MALVSVAVPKVSIAVIISLLLEKISDSRVFAKQVSLFSPHTNTPVGVQGGQIPSLLFYFPSLDSELVNRNANAPEDGRETGDSALGCK